MDKKIFPLVFVVMLVLAAGIKAFGAGTSVSSWPTEKQENTSAVYLYNLGVEASKNNDFQQAADLFTRASRQDRKNPDIFNMLAHAQLKLGRIDESLENYKKALSLRPNFPEAREYLGEAYIQAALREITTLKSYGNEGAENLEDLTKAFKEAAAKLE